MKNFPMLAVLLIFPLFCLAQSKTISGVVIDSKSKKALSFATITIPNTGSGTVTNIDGAFTLKMTSDQNEIRVSYIGYEDVSYSLKKDESNITVSLLSADFTLAEVIVRSKTPWQYIQEAVQNHPSNVAQSPFETRGYFKEKSKLENDQTGTYGLTEAVFFSYFENFGDTTDLDQNQLALLRQDTVGNFRTILLDNKKIKKRIAKNEERESEQEVEETTDNNDVEEYEDTGLNIDGIAGGGPQELLENAKSIISLPFFKEKHRKKFEFTFGENSIFQGKNLIVINFVSKRKIEMEKYVGSIYLDYSNLAIVAIQFDSEIKLPFYIQMLVRGIIGVKIENVGYTTKIQNQSLNDLWYPKELIREIQLQINQKGAIETLQTSQIFNIDYINTTTPQPILEAFRFDQDEDYIEQVKAKEGVGWDLINVVE